MLRKIFPFVVLAACDTDKPASNPDSAATSVVAAPAPAAPTLDAGESMQSLLNGRVWVRGRGLGAGTPLVLVQGAPGTSSAALKPLEGIAEDRLVLRYDLLGTGKSDPVPAGVPVTIARAVEDLERLRRELKIETWHVLGHSYGAAIAAAYASANPGRAVSVVLLNPLLPGTVDDGTHANATSPTFTDSTVTTRFAADLDTLRTMHGAEVGEALRRDAIDTASRVFVVDTVVARLRRTKIATMVIAGAKDSSGVTSARALKKRMPEATLTVYPDAGLYTPWEKGDVLITDIRAFLKKQDKPM